MLKYSEIIEKLTFKQKVALLADIGSFTDPKLIKLGVPQLLIGRIDELLLSGDNGISMQALARSWDVELVESLVFNKIVRSENRADIYICPSPKPYMMGSNPGALSEDWYLSEELIKAIIRGIGRAGCTAIVDGFWLTARDVVELDGEPDERFINEALITPMSKLMRSEVAVGVGVSLLSLDGEYEDINRKIAYEESRGMLRDNQRRICVARTPQDTLSALANHMVLFKGVYNAIENSHIKYAQMKDAVNRGQYAPYALEESVRLGEALSDENIDILLDELIDFVTVAKGLDTRLISSDNPPAAQNAVSTAPAEEASPAEEEVYYSESSPLSTEQILTGIRAQSERGMYLSDLNLLPTTLNRDFSSALSDDDYTRLTLRAHEESIVMLKNEKHLLPSTKHTKIAIIGDCLDDINAQGSFANTLISSLSGNFIGAARGYDISKMRSENLISEAKELARRADLVLVFLTDETNTVAFERALPANQVALLDALSEYHQKMVGIVKCRDTVDMSFDTYLGGVIIMPAVKWATARALGAIISGLVAPSGKLARGFYYKPDVKFKEARNYKNRGYNKVGIFLDYRRYQDNENIGYIFGSGISYSEFTYGDLKSAGRNISLKVTNNGKTAASEIVEIYFGNSKSSIARPDRELRAFARVSLKRGESKYVQFKNIGFGSYDIKSATTLIEGGMYGIYAAASATDVKSSINHRFDGPEFEGRDDYVSSYLQTRSNIVDKKYYLEAKTADMKVYRKSAIFGILSLLVAVALGAGAYLITDWAIRILLASVAVCFAIYSIYKFIRSSRQKKFYKKEKKVQSVFDDAEEVDVSSVKALFDEQFIDSDEIYAKVEEDSFEDVAMLGDVTHSMLSSFVDFAAERGVKIAHDSAAAIIASLASSRLIMSTFRGGEELFILTSLMADFFGGKCGGDMIDSRYLEREKMIFIEDENGDRQHSRVIEMIKEAQEQPERAYFILLRGINAENADHFLSPYIRYFGNPNSAFSVYTSIGDASYSLPHNIWFVIDYTDCGNTDDLPSYLNEVAVYLPPVEMQPCEGAAELSIEPDIAMTSFDMLIKRTRTNLGENEDVWKKLDGIEEFVGSKAAYSMGNRFWLQTENYLSMFLKQKEKLTDNTNGEYSSEDIMNIAMDYTLSGVILPTFASILKAANVTEDNILLSEVERYFGDDNVQISKQMLNKNI